MPRKKNEAATAGPPASRYSDLFENAQVPSLGTDPAQGAAHTASPWSFVYHHLASLKLLSILSGLALAAYVFFSVKHFHPIASQSYGLPAERMPFYYFLILSGFLLAVLGFQRNPKTLGPPIPDSDIGSKASRILLFFILVLGAVMRLYGAGEITGQYWDDFALAWVDARSIVDYHHFFIFANAQDGEPLHAYLLAGFMWLFPRVSGLMAQRLVPTLIDLCAIWLFYLIGKEFGKRRIGLVFASLGAVNQAMLSMLLSCMRFYLIPFFIALCFLLTFRLFKKPSLFHFLAWGFCIGAGYYTYTAFRPWGPFLVLVVLAWIYYKEKSSSFTLQAWHFSIGFFTLLMVAFLYLHRFVFEGSKLAHGLQWLVDVRAPLFYAVFLLLCFINLFRREIHLRSSQTIIKWALGVLMAVAMANPILSITELSKRLSPTSTLSRGVDSIGAAGGILWEHFLNTVRGLWFAYQGREDLHFFGEPFYDGVTLTVIFGGLAFLAARVNWPGIFLLMACGLGILPQVMADSGGNRLVGSIVPFLLLGALGLDGLFETASQSGKLPVRKMPYLVWIALIAAGAWINYAHTYFYYQKAYYPEVFEGRQVQKDCGANRVYLGSPPPGRRTPSMRTILFIFSRNQTRSSWESKKRFPM